MRTKVAGEDEFEQAHAARPLASCLDLPDHNQKYVAEIIGVMANLWICQLTLGRSLHICLGLLIVVEVQL